MAGNEDTQIKPTHGMSSVVRRGRDAMTVAEVASLDQLKVMLDDPTLRQEVRTELAGRLMVVIQRGFQYLEENPEHYATGDGPFRYLLGYKNALARMLKSWPSPVEEAKFVDEIKRIDRVLNEAEEQSRE